MPETGLLLIVSGPSGVGKTTIARYIERQLNGRFSVSMTTRPQTAADVQGRDYDFVDHAHFEQARDTGLLLEWAQVFDHYYGTPKAPVVEALGTGRLMILEIDVQGAVQVKQHLPQACAIFVLPPSEPELLNRLRARKRDKEAAIQKRFQQAKQEIARAKSCGVYDLFIINDDLADAQHQAAQWTRQRLGQP